MIEATQKIITLKNKLDLLDYQPNAFQKIIYNYLLKKRILNPGIHNRKLYKQHIINGKAFLEVLFPFLYNQLETQNRIQKKVDAKNVLSGNYLGYEDVPNATAINIIDTLDKSTETMEKEQAILFQLGAFELYNPYEGKNRISLYRQVGGKVLANVLTMKIPKPDSLQLIYLKPFNIPALRYLGRNPNFKINSHWNRLGVSKTIVPLVFNESISLLESYGVQWGRRRWGFKAFFQIHIAYIYLIHRFYRK